jgi:hypothetical protein
MEHPKDDQTRDDDASGYEPGKDLDVDLPATEGIVDGDEGCEPAECDSARRRYARLLSTIGWVGLPLASPGEPCRCSESRAHCGGPVAGDLTAPSRFVDAAMR